MNLRNKAVAGSPKGLGTWQIKTLRWMRGKRGVTLAQMHKFRFSEKWASASYVLPLVRGLEKRGLIKRISNGWKVTVNEEFWRLI